MDADHLFDELPGDTSGEFAAACARASVALAQMRDLAALVDDCEAGALLDQFDGASAVGREVDLVVARLGRGIERRSEDAPAGGLARRCGHRSTADLMAARRGSTRAEAHRLLEVGRLLEDAENATRLDDPDDNPDDNPDGDPDDNPDDGSGGGPDDGPDPDESNPNPNPNPNPTPTPTPTPTPPPRHPRVAAALAAGELSVEAASQITTMLDALDGIVDGHVLTAAEESLVVKAHGLAADRLARIVRQMRARLDPDGHERELARMRASRMLRLYDNRAGMTVITGLLDPETAAPIRTALDALVGDDLRRRHDAIGEDTRTTDQIRADALARLARHALGCTATDLPLASVTMVVRIDETSLRERTGHGELDGSATPLDIATVRRLAADAAIIPAVLGSHSELLDLGRARRLFTKAQRLALGERDGGCAFCGAPPAWTEVHHIDWWGRDTGPTNLANGVLLCRHCHHTIHSQGWDIHATPTTITFTPPATIDPDRTPRLGGRARFHADPAGATGDRDQPPPPR